MRAPVAQPCDISPTVDFHSYETVFLCSNGFSFFSCWLFSSFFSEDALRLLRLPVGMAAVPVFAFSPTHLEKVINKASSRMFEFNRNSRNISVKCQKNLYYDEGRQLLEMLRGAYFTFPSPKLSYFVSDHGIPIFGNPAY